MYIRMVFFDPTGSEDFLSSNFEFFHIRKINYFRIVAPKLVKSLSNHHKSKVHEISDRFSGAELFLTPPEHRDTTFLIFSDANIPIHYSVKFWLGQIKPSLYIYPDMVFLSTLYLPTFGRKAPAAR